MKSSLLLYSILFVLILSSVPVSAQNGWTLIGSMNTNRAAAGVCVIDDDIYIIGGVGGFPGQFWDLDVNEVYHPGSQTPWEEKPSMPTARGFLYAGLINNNIYAMGGGYLNPCDTNEVYDINAGTWTTKTCLPFNWAGMAGAIVDGKIYLMGGSETGRECWQYDPAADSFVQKSSLPENGCAGALSAVAYNGLIYTFGGTYSEPDSALSKVCVYNPQTDEWLTKAEMPVHRYALGAFLLNGKIYAIGGTQKENSAVAAVEVYDPENDTWESLPDMPQALCWFTGAVYNNQIYIFGGTANWYTGGTDVWRFDPATVDVKPVPVAMKTFELYQNYPNPFNPETKIRYSIEKSGSVTLKIFDILGSEVQTVVNDNKSAGTYAVSWNASHMPGGVYFYQLRSGNSVETKKMMLVK